jgi:hypothetical protein
LEKSLHDQASKLEEEADDIFKTDPELKREWNKRWIVEIMQDLEGVQKQLEAVWIKIYPHESSYQRRRKGSLYTERLAKKCPVALEVNKDGRNKPRSEIQAD